MTRWVLVTIIGAGLAWVIWRQRRSTRPPSVSARWLDEQVRTEARQGWLEGPYWWLPEEWREQTRRERWVRMAEARSRNAQARRKDGTA